MAYIDTLQKVTIPVRGEPVECIAGSFKGVPFFFESADYSGGGRNVQTNGIPFSDDHVNEDTGKKVPSYTFNFYIVGDDAENRKNDFLRACNGNGAGELVHPYFGAFRARCTDVSISYGNQQEYISGTVTFVPENDFELKNSVVSLSGKTRQKAVELRRAVAESAARSFKAAGNGKNVLDKAVEMSYRAVEAAYSARKAIQKAAEFVRQVGSIKSNLQAMMLAPRDFIARLQNLITMSGDVLELDIDPKDTVMNGIDIMSFRLDPLFEDDPQTVANRVSISELVRLTGASVVAENVIACEFESVSEANRFCEIVSDAFEAVIVETENHEIYRLLQELEAASLKHLRESLSRIPYEVEVAIPATNNLLSLVYGVYGNLDELEPVIARNGYRDPLFVKPSEGLLVLCDD